MRADPPALAAPIVPTKIPKAADASPLTGTRPAKIATIDKPRIVTINISGRPKANTTGRAIKTNAVKTKAPNKPPNKDAVNAADSARAACPFFAKGKPSSTVAWEADDPGIPINTLENVSDVGITATKPTIKAKPEMGSIP